MAYRIFVSVLLAAVGFHTFLNSFLWSWIQESHKRAQREKREPLDEDQLFLMDLARDLSRVCQVTSHSSKQKRFWPWMFQNISFLCPNNKWRAGRPHWFVSASITSPSLLSALPLQRSTVLENIWKLDDTWPTSLCRTFILQWASMLESKVLIWEYHLFPEERIQT